MTFDDCECSLLVPAVLRRAADLLEERGWVQKRFSDGGALCVSRALTMAAIEIAIPRERTVYYLALTALENRHGITGPISVWNDQPGRTREEVVAALRSAA